MHFEKARVGDGVCHGGKGRIESLAVSDGENRAARQRGLNEQVGLCERIRQWLFDEDCHSGPQERQGYLTVYVSWRRDDDGVNAIENRSRVAKESDTREGGDRLSTSGILVDDGHELHVPKRGENADVMLPMMTGADNGNAY
jgi:hypothetical protein